MAYTNWDNNYDDFICVDRENYKTMKYIIITLLFFACSVPKEVVVKTKSYNEYETITNMVNKIIDNAYSDLATLKDIQRITYKKLLRAKIKREFK